MTKLHLTRLPFMRVPGWIVALTLAGCGGPAALPTVEVSGNVSYDGMPVADGSVTFAAQDGRTAPVVLAVAAGRYGGRVTVGEKRIEVRAMRPAQVSESAATGPGGGEGPLLENFIPAAYNDASGLSRNLSGPGPVVIDLELEKR